MKHYVNSIKVILITFSIFITLLSSAQNDKIVTLTTNGQGKTSEEAKNNALRSAIEQAFGAFVSSNTSVVNDNLIKDEIVSVSNGNINKYDVLTEQMLPDNTWLVSIKADISPQNLVKFSESKGIKVEFKGALFAANVKILELNKQNELKTMKNCFNVACQILPKSYDFSLEVSEPKNLSGKWVSDITVKANLNDNMKIITDLLSSNLEALSIPDEQINKYEELNIKTYDLVLLFSKPKKNDKSVNENRKKDKKRKEQTENNQQNNLSELSLKTYHFRNLETIQSVRYLLGELLYCHSLYFQISNGIEQKKGYDIGCDENYKKNFEINRLCTNYSQFTLTQYLQGHYGPGLKEHEVTYSLDYSSRKSEYYCAKKYKADFNQSGWARGINCQVNRKDREYLTTLQTLGLKNDYIPQDFLNLYSIQQDNIYFKTVISNTLSTDDISKITQYTVEPIIQINCDK
jgi:hypothetical protein